jgi:hypothetical protein
MVELRLLPAPNTSRTTWLRYAQRATEVGCTLALSADFMPRKFRPSCARCGAQRRI